MKLKEGEKLLTVVATPHDDEEVTDHPDAPDADAEDLGDEAELLAEEAEAQAEVAEETEE
jgi:hypothetical protein